MRGPATTESGPVLRQQARRCKSLDRTKHSHKKWTRARGPVSSITTSNRFFNAGNSQVAVRVNNGTTSSLKWLAADTRNSATISVDSTPGGAVTRQLYTPYGAHRGPATLPTDRNYLNRPLDSATGLLAFGARYYDPTIGRFISPDPAHDGADAYGYASNNPIKFSDPSGLMACICWGSLPQQKTGPVWHRPLSETDRRARTLARVGGTYVDTHGMDASQLQAGETTARALGPVRTMSASDRSLVADELTDQVTVLFANLAALAQAAFEGSLLLLGAPAVARSAVALGGKTLVKRQLAGRAAEDGRAALNITKPYARPGGATTAEQRASVQGRPCVDCGATADAQVADHIDPLVKEYYRTGSIDLERMRSLEAVQPQCPTCSASQGGTLSWFSRTMRDFWGLG